MGFPRSRGNIGLVILISLLGIAYLIMVSFYPPVVIERNESEHYNDIAFVTKLKEKLKTSSLSSNVSENKTSQSYKTDNTKLILIWSPLYPTWDFLQPGKDTFKKRRCSEDRCEVTNDRSRLSDSHAVVFHAKTISMEDIPRFRNPDQKWIFFSMEPPPYSYFPALRFTSRMFNWTMSYRLDSDVVTSYGKVVRTNVTLSQLSKKNLFETWKRKSGQAVALMSHCDTSGNRDGYIKELKKHLDVDVFGLCGKAVCPEEKTKQCLENFSKRYHFFLAFENSICKDYITEKFFRSLKYDSIPVVFGGGNYTSVAPAHSFVNAMDFASPKSLASHLHTIAKNFALFERYFEWKNEEYQIKDVTDDCELCKKLHSYSFQEKSIYSDITDWWLRGSNCTKWK